MSTRLPIWSYEANTKWRDFVVGDIHGCFDLLETGAVFGNKLSLLEIETMTCTEVSVLP